MESSDTARKEQAIMAREPSATTRPAHQDSQLISKDRVFGFSLSDSITASHPDNVFGIRK
jgi:hypothetical protein